MKYLVLGIFFVLTVATCELFVETDVDKLKSINAECRERSHVDYEKVKQMRNRHFTDDKQLKEFLYCYYKLLHWMDNDGHINKEEIMKQVGKNPKAKAAMENCVDKHGNHGPETAYGIFKCYVEHLPAEFKAPIED